MLALFFYHPVVGIDIHWVFVPSPAGPIPTPLPHPFTGIIKDWLGAAIGAAISGALSAVLGSGFQGPVLINNIPAANTGTDGTNTPVMPHFPTPPGTSWAPVPAGIKPPIPGKPPDPGVPTPTPSNDTTMITGSKTVYISGTNACRLGDLSMSCGEPLRLPSSTSIAFPLGSPVLIGGPPALDLTAALMGMIRTEWVSGRLRSAVTRVFGEGSRAARWINKAICIFTGHPVDVASGMVVTDDIDFTVSGLIPIIFERTYYSRSDYFGPLGYSWSHSFDQFVKEEKDKIVLHWIDGRELYFKIIHQRQSARNTMENLTLEKTNNYYIVYTNDGMQYFFGQAGRSDGTQPLLRIEDAYKNRVKLEYDHSGYLISIIDTHGRLLNFINDTFGRLLQVEIPHPEIIDKRIVVARYQYNNQNELIAVLDVHNRATLYYYKHHLLVQETDRNGLSFYFAYDGNDFDAKCVRTWGDGGIYDHILTYDKANRVTIVENSLLAQTSYFADELGRIVKIINPLGQSTLMDYNNESKLQRVTYADGSTETWTYHENGWPLSYENQIGEKASIKYDKKNRIVKLVRPDKKTINAYFNDKAKEVVFENSWGGRTLFRYDSAGRVVISIGTMGTTKQYEYDDNSAPVKFIKAQGETYEYNYTPMGNLKQYFDGVGHTATYYYNDLNQIDRIWKRNFGWTKIHYDGEGNVIDYNSNGYESMQLSYGMRNNVVNRKNNFGETVHYTYDTEGQLIELRAGSAAYKFTYDLAGRLVNETCWSGIMREYKYDGANYISEFVEKTPAKKRKEIRRSFDIKHNAVGRIVSKRLPSGEVHYFEYDRNGLLLIAETQNHRVAMEYDEYGNVLKERQDDIEINYKYDNRGKRQYRKVGDRKAVHYVYDLVGRLIEISVSDESSANKRIIGLMYNQKDQLVQRVGCGNDTTLYNYDKNGLLSHEQIEIADGIIDRRYQYDDFGRIEKISDSDMGETMISYDSAGRILSIVCDGNSFYRKFDNHGRLISVDENEISLGPDFTIKKAGNIEYEFNGFGDLAVRNFLTIENGRQFFIYDDEHRLIEVKDDHTIISRMEYDAFGRRVSLKNEAEEIRFIWEGASIAVESRNNAQYEYIWDNLLPIALISPQGLRVYDLDFSGSPCSLIDDQGIRVWRRPENWWRGNLVYNSEHQPFGLPGQYWDAEIGLFYNLSRYFDPNSWRFLSPDPFGIEGGLDPYGYPPNIFRKRDPLGLILEVSQARGGYQGYPPSDFRSVLEEQRMGRGVADSSNIAVLELKDGRMIPFVNGADGHSERKLLKFMEDNNIRATSVRRIYTELSPCTRKGGCLDALLARFHHLKTRIPVIFNFPWHGDIFDKQRWQAIQDFKATCK